MPVGAACNRLILCTHGAVRQGYESRIAECVWPWSTLSFGRKEVTHAYRQ
jgi:hypothetical protein